MLRNSAIFCLAAVVVVVLSHGAARNHKLHFTQENSNRSVSVARGDNVELAFFGLLSTGYVWQNMSDPRCLILRGYKKQEMPPDNYVWNYTASRTTPGGCSEILRFTCGKPWEPTPADTVSVKVTVTA